MKKRGTGIRSRPWRRLEVAHGTLYIMALYWSVMTATTIGYGDIVPSTDIERLVSTVCMAGLSLPGVRLVYMDLTGCHQLNRVLTTQ